MKEIREIVRAYDEAMGQGRSVALLTVVRLQGSAYRRPGARMLVDDEGRMTGAISGGCLEGDALRKALLVIAQRKPRVVTYDTSDEDDVSIGVQLGCAGVIQVLFEPIDPSDTENPIELLRIIVQKQQPAALACLFSLDRNGDHPGTCYVQFADGSSMGKDQSQLVRLAADVLQQERSLHDRLNPQPSTLNPDLSTLELRIEYIPPPLTLVVAGAGNDAIPLVQIASVLGWDARVVDGRNTHAQAERFTSACQVLVSRPEQVLEQVRLDAQTVFVLMTHNYQYDKSMLQALLPLDIPYVGVLGPRKKLDRMLGEIRESGFNVTPEMLAKVYGPVGLEIGAETSEEIALSIVAEIQAVMRNKTAQSLRNKQGAIHEST